MRALPPSERRFFALVSRAAFSNPFGEERDELDRAIAEVEGHEPDLLARLVARVEARLAGLEERRRLDPSSYGAEDGDRLENAILFHAFHRFAEALDALIVAQLDKGRTPVRVTFADDLLSLLTARGIAAPRARRMLELFWQMRRAYFFIAQGLVGPSPSMRKLREGLWDAVFTHDIRRYERFLWNRMEDFATILEGETGTGKGAAAAAIGRSGFIPFDATKRTFAASFTATFVALNLSQFPESLLESELFGHRKGAFTGAIDAHEGVFARSGPHATIFLDEVGDVRVPVQIKLLRVLQDRVYAPVGSHDERRFEGRMIAATNQPLERLRREGRFRDDFYYRLSSHRIAVPPLRQRVAEDPRELDELVASLVPRMVGESAPELVEEVRQVLETDLGPAYAWPGNVRELEQCIRRVLLTRHCAPDGVASSSESHESWLVESMRRGELDARSLLAGYCSLLHERHGSYEGVARVTGLDRRTVKKHVQEGYALRPSR